MSATDLVRVAMNAAFFVVFAATAWAFVRRPRLDRGVVAVLFGLPAAVIALLLLQDEVGIEVPSALVAVLSMAIPYVTLRAVNSLAPVARIADLLALVGFAASAAVVATPAVGFQGVGLVIMVAYFFTVEAYATWITLREAARTPGPTRARLVAVAFGSLLLGVTLVLAVTPALEPLFPVAALLGAASYFVAFSTPAALRRSWQAGGLRRFLGVASASARLRDTDEALGVLARGMAEVLGSPGAAVGVPLGSGDMFRIVTETGEVFEHPAAGVVGAEALAKGIAIARPPHPGSAWARGMAIVLAAPVSADDEQLGFVMVFARRPSLFLEDDLDLLQLLADQAAIILQNRKLYDELRLAHGELERRLQELKAVNQELSAFAYSVSHDLRAPLRSLDGFSAALLERHSDALDDTGKRYLGFVRESSVEMGHLIDDLLRLSLITRSEMRREEIDLSAIATEIVAKMRSAEPGRVVMVKIEPDMTAVGDRALVRAALDNVLGNAWKFTSKREMGQISVGRVPMDRETFYVRDNGAGFDMRYAGKLFGAFQRLHAKEEFPGTGIGLATVQRVLRRHGGDVWATSEVDCGTTVYFTLSASAAAARQRADEPPREEEEAITA